MDEDLKGWCKPNKEGILRLHYIYGNKIPGIKRHAEKISENIDSKIQYGNALYLSQARKIPLDEIIEVP